MVARILSAESVAGLLTGSLFAVVCTYAINEVDRPSPWFLVLCVFVVALFPIVREIKNGQFDPFEIRNFVIGYYVMQFGVWSLMILVTGETKWPIEVDETFNRALLYSVIGIIFFHIGYRRGIAGVIASKIPAPQLGWNKNRLKIFTIMSCLTGVSAFLYLMNSLGGIDEYLINREYYRAGGLIGKAYLLFASTSLLALPVILLYSDTQRPFGVTWLATFTLWVIPTLIIGYRSLLLLPILQLAIVHNYQKKQLSLGRLTAAALLIIVFLSLIGVWRQYSSFGVGEAVEALEDNYQELVRYALLDNLQRSHGVEVVAVVLDKMRWDLNYEFEWGINSLIEVATVPIPRAWFPDKIESVSPRFAKTFFQDYLTWGEPSGVSPTVIGELYWNFGFIGITLGMFLFGVLSRGVYLWMLKHRSNPGAVILYGVLATFVFLIVEAPTVAANAFFPQLGVVVAVLFFMGRAKRQRVSPGVNLGAG